VGELFGAHPSGVASEGPRVPIDLYEEAEAFLVSIEVPGVPREELRLSVVAGSLVVEGRKREEAVPKRKGRVAFECAERAYGPFRRVVELPGAADAGRIVARLAEGLLTVTLPKIRERRGRKREVPIG
jgi:HSP20 family protein